MNRDDEKIRRLRATARHHRKMAHHFYTHNLLNQRDAALEAAALADGKADQEESNPSAVGGAVHFPVAW